jgi:AcrR family transcriptional regulator
MNFATRSYSMATRAAKAADTKARILQAAVEVHGERLWDNFTLDEIARRSGTTVQTILRIFGGKETLVVLAMQAAPQRQRGDPKPGDIAGAIGLLYGDYAIIGELVIQYLAEEPRYPKLTPQLEAGRQAHRQWLEKAFAPQLAGRSGRARDRMLTAIFAVTDVYIWKLLVKDFQLKQSDAERIVIETVMAISRGGDNGEVSLGLLGRRRQPDTESGRRTRAQKTRA